MRRVFRALTAAFLFPVLYACVQTFTSRVVIMSYASRWAGENPNGSEKQLAEAAEAFFQSAGLWVVGGAAVLALSILFFLMRRAPGGLPGQVGTKPPSPAAIGLLVLCGLAALLALESLLTVLPISETVLENHEQVVERLSGGGLIANLLIVCLLLPVTEEIMFRGMSLRILRGAFSARVAVLMSSVIFAVFHGDAMQIFYALPLGLLLGVSYLWFETIWAPVLLHVAFNAGNHLLQALLPGEVSRETVYLYMVLGAAIAAVCLYGMNRISKKGREGWKESWTFFSGE